MQVFIGYDTVEHQAALLCAESVRRATKGEIEPVFLNQDRLRMSGLYTRPEEKRNGQRWDVISDAPCSTAFSITRFLTPILAQTGYALFLDCDMAVMEDPRNMIREADRRMGRGEWALACVKHHLYTPVEQTKMMGLAQTAYRRKNWSSVMLFNCNHPANDALRLDDVNGWRGLDLHNLSWLASEEIAGLDEKWNQLIGQTQRPITRDGVLHWTLGGPWFPGWEPQPHDDIWCDLADQWGIRRP